MGKLLYQHICIEFVCMVYLFVEEGNHSPTDRNSGSSTCPSDYEVVDNPPMITSTTEMTASAISTQSESDADIKSLQLQNGLLTNEVQSLNNELTSLIQRARQAESGECMYNNVPCLVIYSNG